MDNKCWMMITSDEFYKNGVDNLPEGKLGYTIKSNQHVIFDDDFDELYKSRFEFGDGNRVNLIVALVSVENNAFAGLLNTFICFDRRAPINLIVHEILHPWKEK